MKVEIIKDHVSGLTVGQIKDLPSHSGQSLIDRGIAVKVEVGAASPEAPVKNTEEKKEGEAPTELEPVVPEAPVKNTEAPKEATKSKPNKK